MKSNRYIACLALAVFVILSSGFTNQHQNFSSSKDENTAIKVNLRRKYLRINGQKINKKAKLHHFTKKLGRYTRTIETEDAYVYYFDDHGLSIFVDVNSFLVNEVIITVSPSENFVWTTSKVFEKDLKVNREMLYIYDTPAEVAEKLLKYGFQSTADNKISFAKDEFLFQVIFNEYDHVESYRFKFEHEIIV